jgi:signal transduction protein with GAF and PtsI domain
MQQPPDIDNDNDPQTIIQQQAAEIARLRQQLSDERFVLKLRDGLRAATTAGAIAAPTGHARLLRLIVATAARVIDAQFGSLFLVDQTTEELVFEVSLREDVADLRQHRVPLGHGIAGLVAATGQPMAIADAAQNPLHAVDVAQRLGYQPNSIVCVPLINADQVIGVLELMDKIGARSFSTEDMARLGLFAEQAAAAIELSRIHLHVVGVVGELVMAAGSASADQDQQLRRWSDSFASALEADANFARAAELAELVNAIAEHGEAELGTAQAMLKAFAAYLRSRSSAGAAAPLQTALAH